MITLDQLDGRLLSLLSTNARAGIAEISATLGIARNTVHSRLRRLTDAGILAGFQPTIDLEKAGLGVQAFLALEIDQGQLQHIIAALADMPYVLEVHATTGREDLLVRVATDSHPSLQRLVETVVELPGVVHSNTTLALTTPLPYRVHPLIELLTIDSGTGRATPRA
jgi:DNA-binding Lrp family transcriptional regulator